MAEVAIALGSNLGDRRAHLTWGIERLGALLADLCVSSVIETEPVEVAEPQPPYLNAVVTGKTGLEPEALLDVLLAIERERGRARRAPRAPRTLDLDLLFYDDRVIESSRLTVPHPRLRQRLFVLEPLAEIAPGWRDPVSGVTVQDLVAKQRQLAGR
jgi:2-amino-4-hydroxy-6-hydroxymethyldihydropteridine diphosphokinase